MKKYVQLNIDLEWYDLLSKINEQDVILLNTPNTDFILAWDLKSKLTLKKGEYSGEQLQGFINKNQKEYVFGYLSYDIKNDETRSSIIKKDSSNLDDLNFSVYKNILIKKQDELLYYGLKSKAEITLILKEILDTENRSDLSPPIKLKAATNKNNYLNKIVAIKQEIQNGNIYEMNYCVNFSNLFTQFNPFQTYHKLFKKTQAPFSSFVINKDTVILSASPERFIKKTNNKLVSQPIKGTAKRGATLKEDEQIKQQLVNDPKEISENVMIVDLVRNDLSKIAQKNTVNVTELCHPYTFNTVHQLISTVTCDLKENINFTEVLQATFPMGSMTGAPKISAMHEINKFESFSRGIYSGSIGYIEPNGNFDFNVVIRTIVANRRSKEISVSVGGAITIKSDPLNEYNECMLKLNAIQKTLC